MADLRAGLADPALSRRVVGGVLIVVAAALFLVAWMPVLRGDRVLIGVDILSSCCEPWRTERPAVPHNPIVGDTVLEVLPWQEVTTDAIRHGRLPLWNPHALSGKPLLAGGLAGVFSPFNLPAVPLPPAVGLSLGMLLKLLAAGVGMALFLRQLGARAPATVIGGVAYATSSFMVVWLAWPHTGVTAIMPWAFAAAEWCLAGGGLRAHAALAAAVALQFFAGHAGTSVHLAFGLTLYCAVRWVVGSRDWRALAGLALAGLVGTAAAGVQLLPFVEYVRQSTLVDERVGFGLAHLELRDGLSWLVPNARGTPIYDGGAAGYGHNYNEASGFATVTMLLLSPVGAVWAWLNRRSQGVALVALGVVAAGAVYGPLTPLVGRLPLLSSEGSSRLIALVCLAVAALGGLGVEAVWRAARPAAGRGEIAARFAGLAAGAAGLAGVGLVIARLTTIGGQAAEQRLWAPTTRHLLTFWLIAAGFAVVSALGFAVAGLRGRAGPATVAGLGLLVLGEAWLFAPAYQPQVPTAEVGAPTALTTWLQRNAGDAPIAATGTSILAPDSPTLYGLTDVRTYDAARGERSRTYWKAADPGYHDEAEYTWLVRPGADWLAAAGVRYVLTPEGAELPGTTPTFRNGHVTVSEVPGSRSFAWAAPSWSSASGMDQARDLLRARVSGPPVLEGVPARDVPGAGSPAEVVVTSREAGTVELRVSAPAEQAVVVQQSWVPGWEGSIDGRPAAVHPANVAFQGIVVPAGEHRVRLTYHPASVTAGMALTGVGIAVILLLLLPPPLWGRAGVGGTLYRLVEQGHLKVRSRMLQPGEADP